MNTAEVAPTSSRRLSTTVESDRVRRRARLALRVGVGLAAAVMATIGWAMFDTVPSIWVIDGVWLVGELVPGVLVFAAAGLILMGHRAGTALGSSMLSCSVLWGASVLCAGLFLKSFELDWPVALPFSASIMLGSVGLNLAYCALPQLYPDGPLSGWGWRALFVLTLVIVVGTQVMLGIWNLASFQVPMVEPYSYALVMQIQGIGTPIVLAIVLATLVERIRRGPQRVRRQVGVLAIVWIAAIAFNDYVQREFGNESDLRPLLASAWPPVVVASVAVAIVVFGMYDIRLIVRRAAVYGAMALVLTTIFATVYAVVLLALTPQLADQRWRWVAVMVAVIVVLVADPFRRRLRAGLERRFLGSRGEPLQALARLDALVSADAVELDVYQQIADTVREAVRAPGVMLLVHRAHHDAITSTSGSTPPDSVVVPMVHRGERLGELQVAARTPGELYSRLDQALLDQLARQSAAVVYGLRRDRDIDLLRRETIEAMAEQRMVLGRDLHDGLGPLLAGAGLTADALRRGMPAGSADAEEAGRLANRLRAAATEVRRIAHDLQPSGSGQVGLSGVVADYVGALTGPDLPRFTMDVSAMASSTLPPAIELGMSRVALEAINNVVRHANAEHVVITLRPRAGRLEFVVADDGVGIRHPYVSGLGITSMRSRVEALGGTFDVAPAPEGRGTRLTALVPVPVRRERP